MFCEKMPFFLSATLIHASIQPINWSNEWLSPIQKFTSIHASIQPIHWKNEWLSPIQKFISSNWTWCNFIGIWLGGSRIDTEFLFVYEILNGYLQYFLNQYFDLVWQCDRHRRQQQLCLPAHFWYGQEEISARGAIR